MTLRNFNSASSKSSNAAAIHTRQAILSKGSSFDPNAGNKYGVRRIHHAVTNGNYAEVENLVKAGAKINVASFDGFTPLGSATYKNDLKNNKVSSQAWSKHCLG